MRIGIVVPPWAPVPPVACGGIESVVDQLAVGLRDAGHEVLLAATTDSTCPVPCVRSRPYGALPVAWLRVWLSQEGR
jgi:hypothetical protein